MSTLKDETRPTYCVTARPEWDNDLIDSALEHVAMHFQRGEAMTDPGKVKTYITLKMCREDSERFGVIFLDTRHRVIADEVLFYGTVNGASVYPREVVKKALHHNASAVVFYHNHPSGEPDPSQDDFRITDRLKDTLKAIDVRVLDHIIAGGARHYSMAEEGRI